jgi:hypothetical protein
LLCALTCPFQAGDQRIVALLKEIFEKEDFKNTSIEALFFISYQLMVILETTYFK